MVDVNARPYRSALRERQAAETRAAVLAAARDLFIEHGYGATTVDQVAARAGVSKPTVFNAVGNKQTLLKVVRDVAIAGDDEPTPVSARPSVQRARDAATVDETLHQVVAHITQLAARYAAIDHVLRGAAAGGETDLRELWQASEQQRHTGATHLLDILLSKAALKPGLSHEQAVDILSYFMAPDGYFRLVIELGWTREQYERWLEETLTLQLL
ncbi:MAG: regulatory protein TetR [Frankiales bacterium]|nr:regulatory protein TetR [Frankiales bacterium]